MAHHGCNLSGLGQVLQPTVKFPLFSGPNLDRCVAAIDESVSIALAIIGLSSFCFRVRVRRMEDWRRQWGQVAGVRAKRRVSEREAAMGSVDHGWLVRVTWREDWRRQWGVVAGVKGKSVIGANVSGEWGRLKNERERERERESRSRTKNPSFSSF